MRKIDPYSTLGVERRATTEDIRKAYRNLVLLWHPDRNPSDPEAAQLFAQLQEAYSILSDAKKRSAYDSALLQSSTSVARPAAGVTEASPVSPGAVANPPYRRRASPIRYGDNEFIESDSYFAMGVAAAVFLVFSGAEFRRESASDVAFSSSGLILLAAAFLAPRVLEFLRGLWSERLERYAWSDELRVVWEQGLVVSLLSLGMLTAVGGIVGWLVLSTLISAGAAATLAGTLGRAFVSSNRTLVGQVLGLGVGVVAAAILATLFSAMSALLTASPLEGFRYYDGLGLSVASASAAACLIAAFSSLRDLPVLET